MELLAGVLLGAAVVLGLIGTVFPILPGSLFVAVGAIGYALWAQQTPITVAAIVALIILVAGVGLKYLIPARAVSGDVDNVALFIGGLLGLIGFFVIPIVGLLIGFVLGVVLVELLRTRSLRQAIPATKCALTAAGISILVELVAVLLAGGIIITAVLVF